MSFRADADAATRPADIAFLFHILVDSEPVGDFLLVEGIGRKRAVVPHVEGGRNHAPHVLIGAPSHQEVTLRWGMMERTALWAWADQVDVGAPFRRDVDVLQLTRDGRLQRTYRLIGAWPIEWAGPTFDATESRIPVESLKLVFDAMTVEVPDER
jgi:phage tail-like protein